MSSPANRLDDLLPRIYRQQDAEQGYPLQALLQVIGEQVGVIEDNITRLYDDWFIETCQDWVVPYLGDLIGYRLIHEAGEPGRSNADESRKLNKFFIPRREIANTIAYRRRKGTLPLLEKLAWDVAGWTAHAVEFYTRLGQTQSINHLQANRSRTADLRDMAALEQTGGAYDSLAYTADLRRINSRHTQGRHNIPGIGLFVWRLQSYRVTAGPAFNPVEAGPNCFTFSGLGIDTPLFTAGKDGLPALPVTRNSLRRRLADYYGPGKDLAIRLTSGTQNGPAENPVDPGVIEVADLRDWQYHPPAGKVALDPELGRICFPAGEVPPSGVAVSYYYGMSGDIGGGEYDRTISQPAGAVLYPVAGPAAFNEALDKWLIEAQQAINFQSTSHQPDSFAGHHGVIEIRDSGVYNGPFQIGVPAGCTLQIRAANGCCPIIHLMAEPGGAPGRLVISGGEKSRLTLDGLLITGQEVQINNSLAQVTFRHCTLTPVRGMQLEDSGRATDRASLEIYSNTVQVVMEHCIIGAIRQISPQNSSTEPISISIIDSILDATSNGLAALSTPNGTIAHASLRFIRSTILGQVYAHAIELAENSIFSGLVQVARRQSGFMRFCTIAPGSRTPQTYECPVHSNYEVPLQFNSTAFGSPAYGQLAFSCAREIRCGADDESEMGAFHDLFQPQREANIRTRLTEYTLAGMDAGLIFLN